MTIIRSAWPCLGRSSNSSNPNDDYKFTGYEKDDEARLDLYHANARGYDPVLGRFLQIDPHHFNYPGISSYAYVVNNPLIYSDPTGKDWYLNLQQGRVVWFDGSDDRYDDGFVNIGELNGLDNTSIGDITDRLDELGYEYGMSAEEGLVVDTEGRYKAWAMEQIFSPGNVGMIFSLGYAGSVDATRRQGSAVFNEMSKRSWTPIARSYNTTDDLISAMGNTKALRKGGTQGYIRGNIESIFNSLKRNGSQITPDRIRMNDGSFITKGSSTTTGEATLWVDKGGQIYKIRVVE